MKTTLENAEIHLWQVSLAQAATRSRHLAEHLDVDERSRAARLLTSHLARLILDHRAAWCAKVRSSRFGRSSRAV